MQDSVKGSNPEYAGLLSGWIVQHSSLWLHDILDIRVCFRTQNLNTSRGCNVFSLSIL